MNIWVDSTENKLNLLFIKKFCVTEKYLIHWKKKLTERKREQEENKEKLRAVTCTDIKVFIRILRT